ncbi:MAG TPA: dihydrodipicolinate synthase family protein, partial [Acidobacteriota bacterium]|nr:dihydrodipicolinate synthase family protein [Acidobacteriota bacterium]
MNVDTLLSQIRRSVLAVPPLARRPDLSLNESENEKLIDYLISGGVRTLLYGGNANFYHVGLGEFPFILDFLSAVVPKDIWVIPSVGPTFGNMMDQAEELRDFDYETVMVL